jgi:hypothetical protein
MSLPADAIDRIVANVLSQLGAPAIAAPALPAQTPRAGGSLQIASAVVTAELLDDAPRQGTVQVLPKAIVTPAAWDLARERGLQIRRGAATAAHKATGDAGSAPAGLLLAIVKHTPALKQLCETLPGARRELLGCPDDAAKLAIGEICRGGVAQTVILAEQIHRAACLANRNESIKAVAVRDAADIKQVRGQLRANVWCISPGGRSYFELKTMLKEIQNAGA